jgi:hypothetical protein
MNVGNIYPMIEGTEVHVREQDGWFTVAVYDADAYEYLPTSYIFNSLEKARSLAKEIAMKGEFV